MNSEFLPVMKCSIDNTLDQWLQGKKNRYFVLDESDTVNTTEALEKMLLCWATQLSQWCELQWCVL